jgi:asparagine synthase (glutamine-hydrolysing)
MHERLVPEQLMCGILGGMFRRPVREEDVAAFRRALRTLEHRGPDAEGGKVSPEANTVLAFRRLAIIDLVTGDQPMSTETGQHIIFNGEIYNYQEHRKVLVERGFRFHTTSDTEVLLHALTDKGIGGLEPLRGMWGLAYLDTVRRELLLVRDRLGVKQLYYSECQEGLFFASEPKALLSLPWITRRFAQEQLPAYFTFRAVPAPATLFHGISKLAAGTCLNYKFDTGSSTVERYWSPPPADAPQKQVPFAEAVDRVESALLEAIRRRLVADVPVGAFLSGGLDSSLVVAGMRRLASHGAIVKLTKSDASTAYTTASDVVERAMPAICDCRTSQPATYRANNPTPTNGNRNDRPPIRSAGFHSRRSSF